MGRKGEFYGQYIISFSPFGIRRIDRDLRLGFSYEEDTHFHITYVICRCAGMTDAESLKVAAVDEGMDDSKGTVANGGILGIIPNIREESLWHALDEGGEMGATGIVRRKDELFKAALFRPTTDSKLFCLGVFFHYQGDTWAHRHHYDGNVNSHSGYTTYWTPVGHARHGHQPDRPPFDPVCAVQNFEDGLKYAVKFVHLGLNRTPNLFFDGFQPIGTRATIDTNWAKNGPFFLLLSVYGKPKSPQKIITELIRTQISCYDSHPDVVYLGRHTADQVAFELVRRKLNTTLARYAGDIGYSIVIPTQAAKEALGFQNLATDAILAGMQQ